MNDLLNRVFRFQEKYRLDPAKKYDMQEITERIIKNLFGDEHSYAELTEKGFLYRYAVKGKEAYNYYYWPGNKTRHPIYFNRLKESGHRLKRELDAGRDPPPRLCGPEGVLQVLRGRALLGAHR